MEITTVIAKTCNYKGETTLEEKFLQALQEVIDNGGHVISVVSDTARCKKAYVMKPLGI